MITFFLNDRRVETDADADMPLLWVVRDAFKPKGAKYGCGAGLCGACTMHVDGEAVRSCILAVGDVAGQRVTTIEGLGSRANPHPLQAAWVEHSVPQCGYCQSGQLMSAAALLSEIPNPSDDDIDAAMNGNICRCGTYGRIRRAIRATAAEGDAS